MHYQISRNGQTYGPYTLEDLRRYLETGNVLPGDLTKSEEMAEWIPVSQVLAATPQAPFPAASYADANSGAVAGPVNPASLNSAYPDPPNLHWGLVLVFGFLCSFFWLVWLFVQASWMRKVQPTSQALLYYAASVGALVLGGITSAISHAGAISALFFLAYVVLLFVGHFSLRASLEEHYNVAEPIGLKLGPVMTFFFNTVYFQYHFNRINEAKSSALFAAPRGF